jgi:hypothetical protein
VAGLDPAIHVFFRHEVCSGKDVDARDKPGQGGFFVATAMPGRRNGTLGGNDELQPARIAIKIAASTGISPTLRDMSG